MIWAVYIVAGWAVGAGHASESTTADLYVHLDDRDVLADCAWWRNRGRGTPKDTA